MRNDFRARMVVIISALVVGLGASAYAGPFARPKSPKARRALKAGNTHLKVRDFDKAIAAYKVGYKLEQKSIFLNNLGLAHRLKGEYNVAISYYRTVLRDTKLHKVVRTSIRKLIKQMQDELGQAARTKPPVEPERGVTKPKSVVKQSVAKPSSIPKRLPVETWYTDHVGWGLSGAGVLVAGVGLGFLASASGLRGDARREPSAATRDELNARADTRGTWGGALSVIGIAALVGGVVKLVLHNGTSVRVSSNFVSLVGRF